MCDPPAVDPCEIPVVRELDAGKSGLVIRRPAQHMARERPHGIGALDIFGNLDAGQLFCPDGRGDIHVDIFSNSQQLALRGQNAADRFLLHLQVLCENAGLADQIRLDFLVRASVAANGIRADPDGIRRGADRQVAPVAVANRSADRLDGAVFRLLIRRHLRVFRTAYNHVPAEPERE